MTKVTFPIETKRLHLRPCNETDFDFLLDMHSREDVVRYLPWDVQDEEGIRGLIEKRKDQCALEEDDDKLNLLTLEKETGARIGEVGLFLRSKEHKGGEIGFVLHPDHHQKVLQRRPRRASLSLGLRPSACTALSGAATRATQHLPRPSNPSACAMREP